MEGISCFQLWCQNKSLYSYDTHWQVLSHVYTAVIQTSKWPCQISLESLIMSVIFNVMALGSSILFSIKGIILRLLTGPWQFLNDVSHLPLGHLLKAWLLARCRSTCQSEKRFGSFACTTYSTSNGTDEDTWLLSHQSDRAFTDVRHTISSLQPSHSQSSIRSWGFLCH